MRSIVGRRNIFTAIVALVFMAMGVAQGGQLAIPQAGQWHRPYSQESIPMPQPWKWLVNEATVLTTAGKGWVTSKIDEGVQTTGDFVGWGTGAGTAAVADTTLFTEDSAGSPTYARVSATRTIITTTVTNDTVQWVATITSNGSKTITNAGNFTASTSGTLIVKGDFTGIALALNDSIQFTITLQFT